MIHLTHTTKPASGKTIVRQWHLIDAKNKVLGRLTSTITRYLIGKHRIDFVPHLNLGDYVVVINASHVKVTGKKEYEKLYSRYSGYPGGLTMETFSELQKRKPGEVIYHAVSGMLPKNKLRKRRLARLFIFKDDSHPYHNQFPKVNT